MLNVFFIIVFFVLGGIGFVIYLLTTDKSFQDEIETVSISDLLSDKNIEIDLSQPITSQRQFPEQSSEFKKSGFNFKRLFKKEISANSFDDIYTNSLTTKEENQTIAKFSFSSLKNNLPFFKKKSEPLAQDENDVMLMMRTNLGLGNETTTSVNPAGISKNIPSSGGTASLTTSTTTKENEREEASKSPHEFAHQKYSPSVTSKITATEHKTLDRQIENSIIDSEMQQKYLRLEKILKEQTEECSRLHVELKNEINNRKNFNQVKDLLEKELADTKESSRKAQNDLKSALLENENFQKRILITEEKIKNLERILTEKELEIESIFSKRNQAAEQTPSPNSYLSQEERSTNELDSTPDASQSESTIEKPTAYIKNILIDDDSLKDPWINPRPIKTSPIEDFPQIKSKTTSLETDLPPTTVFRENEQKEEEFQNVNDSGEFLSLKNDIFDIPNNSEKPITLDLRKNHEIINNPDPETPKRS